MVSVVAQRSFVDILTNIIRQFLCRLTMVRMHRSSEFIDLMPISDFELEV